MKSRLPFSLTISATLLLGATAYAQDKSSDQTSGVEEVTVTGSRIERDGYTTPTPVTVATTEDLFAITPTNIPDGLNKLPQFQMSSSPSRGLHNWPNEDTHGNILNLRSLGGPRTLILMDGIRLPPTTYYGNVDVNVIPNLLVNRVEVVTGGASAAYGSDAVAGVVNFVLDKQFTGIKGNVEGGTSAHGDNENQRASLAGGFNFGEHGHAMFSGEYYNNDGMLRSDRQASRDGWIYSGSVPGCTSDIPDACVPGNSANPLSLWPDGRLLNGSNTGLISSGPDGFPFIGQVFNPDGTLRPFDPGTPTGSAGFGSGGDGFNIPRDVSSVAPFDTKQFFGRGDYDFSERLTGYVQGIASRTNLSYTSLANSWISSPYAPIYSGNPYLPADVQAAMGPDDVIHVAEYNGMGQKPETEEQTDFWMLSAGLKGNLGESDNWTWRADVDHGESKHTADQSGQYYWQHAYAALDAVLDDSGNIVCHASLDPDPAIAARFADCKPINILGVDPAVATPEGYAYATGTSSYQAKFKQDSVDLTLSGSPVDLPAGPLDIAFGAEYRKQDLKLTTNADPASLDTPEEQAARYEGLRGVSASHMTQNFWLTNIGTADGSVNVKEAFAEVNVPLLANKAGAQKLDFNAASRYTDYSTSGNVNTWKTGLQWRPVDALLLRGTVSRDIRAPSLFSLFKGDQFNIGTLFDPVTNTQANIQQVAGGSPDLQPEKADTYTTGFALSPSAWPGFRLSMDYYKIKIDGAIGSLNVNQIVNNCYLSNGTAPECDLITRPAPDQFPTLVRLVESNIAFLKTSGIDIDGSYSTGLGKGNLSLRLYANHLLKYETQQNVDSPVLDYTGIAEVSTSISSGRPKWSGIFTGRYDINNYSFLVSEQFIGSMTIARPGLPSEFVDNKADTVYYTDLTVSHNFDVKGGSLEVFGTVNNLFDKDAPIIPSTIPGSTYPTIIGVYDYIGRVYNLGVRFSR